MKALFDNNIAPRIARAINVIVELYDDKNPPALFVQGLDKINVRNVGWEFVAQRNGFIMKGLYA